MRSMAVLSVLFLSCGAHLRSPEAVAWERIEQVELGDPTGDRSALNWREQNVIAECDRFVADFPASPQRYKAAYVAARVFHAHG
jgi:hypothetical protein